MRKHKNKRILIVDDDPTCLLGTKQMLRISGKIDLDVYIDLAMNGLEAINTIKAAFAMDMSHELILMDINMPEMDGIAATKAIRSLFAS